MLNNIYTLFFGNITVKNSNAKFYNYRNRFIFIWFSTFSLISKYLLRCTERSIAYIYSSFLQTSNLSIYILPHLVNRLLILANVNSLLKNTLNKNGIYTLQLKQYNLTHIFNVIQHKKNINYLEMNPKLQTNTEIANFYYHTRIQSSRLTYAAIIFYYFNKIVTTHESYFYWVNDVLTNNFESIISSKSSSYNRKIYLYFVYLNTLLNINNAQSFCKLNLTQFKGVNNFAIQQFRFNTVSNAVITNKTYGFIKTTAANIRTTSNILNEYFSYYITDAGQQKSLAYIVANHYKIYESKIVHFKNSNIFSQTLKLLWYTKVHNTKDKIVNTITILYLRAARHFNKGRYSRNRQLYRTGVYWCIWLNVVIVYALHYYFYRVVFAFGYLWFPLGVMILSIFSSRLYKYRFYNLTQLFLEFKEYNNWLFFTIIKLKLVIYERIILVLNWVRKFFGSATTLFTIHLDSFLNNIKNLLN